MVETVSPCLHAARRKVTQNITGGWKHVVLGENARPSYVEVLFHAANYTKNSVPLAAVAVNCDPPMGTIVKGQSRSDSTSQQFRCVLASVHHLVRWVLAVRLASRKPVMSPSYSHSAAFAALALCNPYSEVPPPGRTRGAGSQSHSSGTGHLLLSWKPDRLRQDV